MINVRVADTCDNCVYCIKLDVDSQVYIACRLRIEALGETPCGRSVCLKLVMIKKNEICDRYERVGAIKDLDNMLERVKEYSYFASIVPSDNGECIAGEFDGSKFSIYIDCRGYWVLKGFLGHDWSVESPEEILTVFGDWQKILEGVVR